MRAFFRSRLFGLRRECDAESDRYPAPGLELAAVVHSPEIPVHQTGSAFSVRVVAVPKDSPFVAAHQSAGLDLLRLPFGKLLIWILRLDIR
jgi:hypothetical protein